MDLREEVVSQCRRMDTAPGSTEQRDAGRFQPVNAGNAAAQRLAGLTRVIEAEIIPRLMLAHASAPEDEAPAGRVAGIDEVVEFARVILEQDVMVAAAYVDGMRARGVALTSIFLNLLAPAAQRLGAMWEADLCSFTEVTLGLWRLQQLLHELSPAFQRGGKGHRSGRRALLVPVPGDYHTFGLSMVIEFFERAGWHVSGAHPESGEQIVRAVQDERFDLVGLSAGTSLRFDVLAPVISDVRRVSLNRSIGVMVGGPIFVEHPEYAALVGADVTAANGNEAVLQAEKIVAFRQIYN